MEWGGGQLKENNCYEGCVLLLMLLMINSRQEGASAEFRDHAFPPILPKKAGGGSTQASVAR